MCGTFCAGQYSNTTVCFFSSVSRTGDVTYAVNGEDKGLFFSGVDTSKDLWAMLDIYGNTVAVDFSHANAELELPNVQSHFDTSPVEHISQSVSSINFRENNSLPPSSQSPAIGPESVSGSQIQIQYHTGVQFNPLPFHSLQGRNVRVSSDHTTAVRLAEEYCNAFVFTSRSLVLGETIVIQVLGIDRSYIGGLGFGLTACDPGLLHPAILPDDSDLLLDRPEYWVVNKDVCRNPEVGDELSFHVTPEGEVRYARNNNAAVTLMHVDRTLPLWAFFDVYGNIQKVKILGSTMSQVQGHLQRPQSVNPYVNNPHSDASMNAAEGGCYSPNSHGFSVAMPSSQWHPRSNVNPTLRSNSVPEPAESKDSGQKPPYPSSVPATPTGVDSSQEDSGECKVCCERAVNCVLYTCGHMCLCYTCATVIQQQRGECPICRRQISDIIKVYRA